MESGLAKTRAHTAGIVQLSIAIVIPKQQRAEVATRSTRVGPPDDDELLAAGAFDLEPSAAALGKIRIVPSFGDNALERCLARGRIELRASTHDVIAVAEQTLWRPNDDLL